MKITKIKNKEIQNLDCEYCLKVRPCWRIISNKTDIISLWGDYCDSCIAKFSLRLEKEFHKFIASLNKND